jgi:arabinosaccharide transport system substrate-binding protein
VPLVAGPHRIANSLGGSQILTQVVENGYLLCMICPDWRSRVIEVDMPRLSGKMALMPLPAPAPGGRRTSTWGGTMLGITKKTPDPDLAWELAMHLYYVPETFNERFRNNNILPPLRDAWDLPALNEPRPYWSGQSIGKLFSALADQTPPQYTSPYTPMAKAKMSEAVVQCVLYYNQFGEAGFDAYVRKMLKTKADDLRKLMKRNPFL